jgi:hypothetical protein
LKICTPLPVTNQPVVSWHGRMGISSLSTPCVSCVQIFKVFVLSRVTLKSFKSLPGMPGPPPPAAGEGGALPGAGTPTTGKTWQHRTAAPSAYVLTHVAPKATLLSSWSDRLGSATCLSSLCIIAISRLCFDPSLPPLCPQLPQAPPPPPRVAASPSWPLLSQHSPGPTCTVYLRGCYWPGLQRTMCANLGARQRGESLPCETQ